MVYKSAARRAHELAAKQMAPIREAVDRIKAKQDAKMKKVDLKRERGYPFMIAVAHMANGESLMLTGGYSSISDYLDMIDQPMIVKRTTWSRSIGKFFNVDIRLPRAKRVGCRYSIRLEQLSAGELSHARRFRSLYGQYRFISIRDLEQVRARRMFCLTKVEYGETNTSTVLCTLRSIPDTFPDKIREALKEHTDVEGL